MNLPTLTFTIATANEAGINEKAMLITIAAEKASRSYNTEQNYDKMDYLPDITLGTTKSEEHYQHRLIKVLKEYTYVSMM